MATYVMSDIHGQRELFYRMLKQINFTDKDKLYILGDVIDRGPAGIKLLLEIAEKSNIKMLLGNHEHMMKTYFTTVPPDHETLSMWMSNGGTVTISQYKETTTEEKQKILEFIKKLPVEERVTVNDREFILCHAQPHPTSFKKDPFDDVYIQCNYDSDDEFSVWHRYQTFYHSRYRNDPYGVIPDENFSDVTVIFGHTPVYYFPEADNKNGNKIYYEGNTINVDCGCASIPYDNNEENGRLACLRLDDMQEFYEEP